MIVDCSNCGKKYRIDSSKLSKIGSKTMVFTCTRCKQKVRFTKPNGEQTPQPSSRTSSNSGQPPETKSANSENQARELDQNKKPRLSLRRKMTVLFVIFPVILILISNGLMIFRMNKLSTLITDTSSRLLTVSGEKVIAEKARAVAKQVSLYLFIYPNLAKENFNNYREFQELALQKVGETGYTYLLSHPTATQPSRIWIYPDDELIGTDTCKSMRKILTDDYESWKRIHDTAFETGLETDGYYYEKDHRKKYMVMVPVADSELFIVSTTYIDEFTQPVKELQNSAQKLTESAIGSAGIMLFATIILIGTIAYLYGSSISKRILNLTTITDRISVGDLDAKIPHYAQDEIGMLAEGIRRMQDSLRLSLDRLRRRAS